MGTIPGTNVDGAFPPWNFNACTILTSSSPMSSARKMALRWWISQGSLFSAFTAGTASKRKVVFSWSSQRFFKLKRLRVSRMQILRHHQALRLRLQGLLRVRHVTSSRPQPSYPSTLRIPIHMNRTRLLFCRRA